MPGIGDPGTSTLTAQSSQSLRLHCACRDFHLLSFHSMLKEFASFRAIYGALTDTFPSLRQKEPMAVVKKVQGTLVFAHWQILQNQIDSEIQHLSVVQMLPHLILAPLLLPFFGLVIPTNQLFWEIWYLQSDAEKSGITLTATRWTFASLRSMWIISIFYFIYLFMIVC
jgi:hypothetical protein